MKRVWHWLWGDGIVLTLIIIVVVAMIGIWAALDSLNAPYRKEAQDQAQHIVDLCRDGDQEMLICLEQAGFTLHYAGYTVTFNEGNER